MKFMEKKNINTNQILKKKIHFNYANYYNIELYDLEKDDSPIFQNMYRTIKEIFILNYI